MSGIFLVDLGSQLNVPHVAFDVVSLVDLLVSVPGLYLSESLGNVLGYLLESSTSSAGASSNGNTWLSDNSRNSDAGSSWGSDSQSEGSLSSESEGSLSSQSKSK